MENGRVVEYSSRVNVEYGSRVWRWQGMVTGLRKGRDRITG